MPAPLNWIDDLGRVCAGQSCVLVTLMIVSGSAPRESGSRMIVAGREVHGSIGGGNLEFKAIERGRALLQRHDERRQECELYGLGPALNQCCGGAVALHFEVVGQGRHTWLEQLWEDFVPDELDKELGAILMVLSFFTSQEVAAELVAESGAEADSPDEMAARMIEILPEAMAGYAHMGRTIDEVRRNHEAEVSPAPARSVKIGPNQPCPCGSGRKYKKCCGAAVH